MKTHADRLVLVLAPLALACFTLIVFLLLTPTSSASPGQAAVPAAKGSWVITTNYSDTNIYIVNTADNTVHGPFLEGQLGSQGGGLFDVAVTPDGKTALVSNFWDQAVYFIDLSNPTSPTLDSALPVSVTLPMPAEDIAITHDGRFALVTDGMLSSIIASIDIVARTVVYTLDMSTMIPPHDAQAIAVAPNGTVVYVNYFGGEVGSALIDASGYLTHTGAYLYMIGDYWGWPINVGIAPDGQTVIVCDASTSTVGIYQVTAPGVLSYTGIVTGLLSEVFTGTPGAQSVAFNAAGDKAYVVLNGRQDGSGDLPDQLAVLDITGPGRVSLNTASAVTLPRTTADMFYGVDVIAVAGDKAYVGYPTDSSITETNPLAVATLTDYNAIPLDVGGYPVGVATIPPQRLFLPLVFHNYVVVPDLEVKD